MTAGSAEAAGWAAALLVLLRVVELAIGENILGGTGITGLWPPSVHSDVAF